MRVLLIKTSSMGDLIHTFPALTDASEAIPSISFDWVVEDTFKVIPTWHPVVNKVIPVSLRTWRKKIFSKETRQALHHLRSRCREEKYDLILDAQGLMKSVFIAFFAKGRRVGLDFKSAREGLASFAYQRKYSVDFYQHAVLRMRDLFSQALHYPLPTSAPQFGIHRKQFEDLSSSRVAESPHRPYIVFLHGTTWESKQWPEAYWIELAKRAGEAGYQIKVSGSNEAELARALRIALQVREVEVLPHLSILNMAKYLVAAKAVVAVDTGLGHLAAALNVPTISLYGATDPHYTGALGSSSMQMKAHFPCAPCLKRNCTYNKAAAVTPACYGTLSPQKVWAQLMTHLRT